MAKTSLPNSVKLFVAVLWANPEVLNKAYKMLQDKWGSFDFEGEDHAFDITEYYENEMGKNLKRRFIAFEKLVSPEILVNAKITCNEIEEILEIKNKRGINLDIGYLDHNKIILASAKGAGQKIYLSDGIYADFIARFGKGNYQPFEWCFPDFKDGRYNLELLQIRDKYLIQLKNLRNVS